MDVDLVAEHWNDALTLLTSLAVLVIGYYQVQHYRAQSANLRLARIEDADYSGRRKSRGELIRTENPSEEGDLYDTHYRIETVVENSGRNPATISDFELLLPDTDEELEMFNRRTKRGWDKSPIKLDANDRKDDVFFTSGEVRDEYPETVEGTLKLESATGNIEREITFELSG